MVEITTYKKKKKKGQKGMFSYKALKLDWQAILLI